MTLAICNKITDDIVMKFDNALHCEVEIKTIQETIKTKYLIMTVKTNTYLTVENYLM